MTTSSAPWARLKDIRTEQDLAAPGRPNLGFRFVLDFAGEEVVLPAESKDPIPAKHGNTLAKGLLALSLVDERAAVELPGLGAIRLGNLADAAAILIAYYPGDIATQGLPGLVT